MAGEIQMRPYLRLSKDNVEVSVQPRGITLDQTGSGFYHAVLSIATSEESIAAFGDVTTEGILYLRNTDATNYVQWGFSTTVYGGRMEAGESAGPFRAEPGLTLYLKANTGACLVEVLCLED
jgi:hypothetical protein